MLQTFEQYLGIIFFYNRASSPFFFSSLIGNFELYNDGNSSISLISLLLIFLISISKRLSLLNEVL